MTAKGDIRITWEKIRLDNGLTVIHHEDHRLPLVAVNVWYHVGSKDEVPGRTGFAHLFEHMMFQGSEHYDEDFFKPLEEAGGRLNGSTAEDRTNYWEVVPTSYIERALFLESDRMGYLLPAMDQAKLDNQREVVKNERRETLENQPYGIAEELLLEAMYPVGHPYHHSVIGSMEDLDAATLDDVKSFFRKFYIPNNASLCIAGDIKRDRAVDLVQKYFSEIPRGQAVSPMKPDIPVLTRPVRVQAQDRIQLPRLYLQWPTVLQLTEEDAALSALGYILQTGKDSRLVKRLQVDDSLAQSIYAFQRGLELDGTFTVMLTAQPGRTLPQLEDALWEEVARIREEGPTPEEVANAKAALRLRVFRQLQNLGDFGGVSDILNYYQIMIGDPGYLPTELAMYEEVTAHSVREAARRHLSAERYVALEILPAGVAAPKSDRSQIPGPGPEGEFQFPEVHRETLPNGLDLWVLSKEGLPIVSVEMALRAGASCDPPSRPGLAAVAADLLDEGAAGMDVLALSKRLKSLGATFRTDVQYDTATFSMNLLKEHFKEGIRFLGDVILRPDLAEKDLQRILQEHLANLAARLVEVDELGRRAMRASLYGDDAPYGHPSDGSPDGLRGMTAGDISAFYGERYRPDAGVVVVAGDISHEEARGIIEGAFSGWKVSGEPAALPATPAFEPRPGFFVVPKENAPQSFLMVAQPGVDRGDPDYPAFLLFNAVFGGLFTSRINMNLREEKGFTYGVRSSLSFQRGVMPWVMSTSIQTDKTRESLQETLGELRTMLAEHPVEEREFEDARANMILRYPQSFETLSQLASGLVSLWIHGLPADYHEWVLAELRGLTRERVQAAGVRVLSPTHLTWVVVGDETALRDELSSSELGPYGILAIPGMPPAPER